MLADHGDGLGRGDVVAGAPVFFTRDAIEVLLDDLLPPRQSEGERTAYSLPVTLICVLLGRQ